MKIEIKRVSRRRSRNWKYAVKNKNGETTVLSATELANMYVRGVDVLSNTRSTWTMEELLKSEQKENIRRKTRPKKPPGTLSYFTRCCYARTALFARIIIYVHMGNLLERRWFTRTSTSSTFRGKYICNYMIECYAKFHSFASSSIIFLIKRCIS